MPTARGGLLRKILLQGRQSFGILIRKSINVKDRFVVWTVEAFHLDGEHRVGGRSWSVR